MLAASMVAVDEGCDIFIATAAVADYRPLACADQKLKKSQQDMSLALVRNPDTLAAIAGRAKAPFTVGFAAETTDVIRYATDKLTRKHLNMIVANDVSRAGVGFNGDENAVTAVWAGGQQVFGQETKVSLSGKLITLIAEHFRADVHSNKHPVSSKVKS